jgi:NADH-quinone oxidoreductase subunit N
VNNINLLPIKQLQFYAPECALAIGVLVFVVLACTPINNKYLNGLTSISACIAYWFLLIKAELISNSVIHRDANSVLFGGVLAVGFLIVQVIKLLLPINKSDTLQSIGLLALALGCTLLPLSTNYGYVYLLVELISLSAYFLVVQSDSYFSAEAALKYFVFGGVSSAIMLYGITLQYGFQGDLTFANSPLYLNSYVLKDIAGIAIILGLLFKLGAFPMHSWVADVYQASNATSLAAISFIPKVAAVVILSRLLAVLGVSSIVVINTVIVLAMIGITYGNIMAIRQKSMFRLLGYSSIAQASLLLLLPLLGIEISSVAALYLIVAYGLGTIGFIVWMAAFKTEDDSIVSFSGLAFRYPFASIILLVLLLNLVGLPPFLGFTGKLILFADMYAQFERTANVLWIAAIVIGILNAALSLFYYLRPSFRQYMKPMQDQEQTAVINYPLMVLAGIMALACVLLFAFPEVLTNGF